MTVDIVRRAKLALRSSRLGMMYRSKKKKNKSYANALFDEHVSVHLRSVEKDVSLSSMNDGFEALRPLGLEDFGNILWNMPSDAHPKLSKVLPTMSPDDVTIQWTGAAGPRLLEQSLGFVRSCAENYATITGKSLKEKQILDFGCGYGRFLRLFSSDIPQVACRLTSRSPDFARWASVFRPERCLSSRKRPKSGGSSLEPAAFWPGRAAFPRGRRTCPAAFVQLGHGSWSCA